LRPSGHETVPQNPCGVMTISFSATSVQGKSGGVAAKLERGHRTSIGRGKRYPLWVKKRTGAMQEPMSAKGQKADI
jgi:hypothetical protein